MKRKTESIGGFFSGDTICALATSPGAGALSLIRISGPQSFHIVRQLCPSLKLKKLKSHQIYYSSLVNPKSGKHLDSVLVFCFKHGHSFTGEESIELSCHGGDMVSSSILKTLTLMGARIAERGEFSWRAFMNGKMDLTQAESVLQLIQSKTPRAQDQALRGLKGEVSHHLKKLEKKLLTLLSHLEAGIDFSDQEIDLFSLKEQKALLKEIKTEILKGIEGFKQAEIDQKGFSIVLLGAPNAGKSSLFNCLSREEKAIVTSLAGTTRDVLSAYLLWNGRSFCLKDTAGFRKNPNIIEQKGIKKAEESAKEADLCLFLVESTLPLKEGAFFGLKNLDPEKTQIVFSKSDQFSPAKKVKFLKEVLNFLDKKKLGRFKNSLLIFTDKALSSKKKTKPSPLPLYGWLSSQTGDGTEELKKFFIATSEKYSDEIWVSTPRGFAGLKKVLKFLDKAEKLLEQEASLEFIAFELKSALLVLYHLLGKEYNEEIIKEVFKEFCIGK